MTDSPQRRPLWTSLAVNTHEPQKQKAAAQAVSSAANSQHVSGA